ncbi:hypothetical protein [Winogradskyella forsetii]|uniref:hypothetical protein n=1 Tax=Winogradskyella forsetii TaxID=2686077 RepID=UPI0015B9F9FB|nr:hypothetical protein [Winogradskyella forsetii]
MKTQIFFVLSLILSMISFAQVEFEKKNGLVSSKAYSKKIATDFNYLILGENSPQQGISATLNDAKSNIKLSGLLYARSSGVLSVEADLSSSNGIYFFDQEKGSEKGKITFNYYRPIKRWSEYYKVDDLTKVTANLQILDLITKTKNEYEGLRKLMDSINIHNKNNESINIYEKDDGADDAYKVLREIIDKYINSIDSKGFDRIKEEKIDEAPYFIKEKATDFKQNKPTSSDEIIEINNGKNSKIIIENGNGLKLTKLLQDYAAKREFIIKRLEDSINKIELKTVEAQWAGNHIFFVGINPFYERQSFNRFTYDSTQTFQKMFVKERGNTYGLTFSLNYSLEKGKGSRNIYKPESLFLRLSASVSRTSNISSFKNSTLDITTPVGNDVNGNPVTFTNTDSAFIGDSIYEFGFGRKFVFDAYYYPFSLPVGIFGILGYELIVFNRNSLIDDKELYPMRLGMLFSLANKEKNKPLITIQAFIDRTDLNLSPNSEDNDLRFGLGIGLPINFN